MLGRFIPFLKRQDARELARQYDVLAGMHVARMLLTGVGYGAALIFLPLWVCALLCLCDVVAETAGLRAIRGLDPSKQVSRYFFALFCTFVPEFCYTLAAAMLWQMDDAYAKALAVAMVSLAQVQLTTVRTIHLPFALTGLLAIVLTGTIGNTVHWLVQDNLRGFVLSTICILAGSAFILSCMVSIHALHVGLVRERVAAQEADQAKGLFLAHLSHELRTPLNAIMGMGEAELALSNDSDARVRLGVLVDSSRGLAVILDDILDMSAIAQGRLSIRPNTADPKATVSAVVEMFRQSFAQAGLAIDLAIYPGLPQQAHFDAQRLRQCLTNLLSNALKFSAGGVISVTAGPTAHGGLVIEVSDTGPGLTEAEVAAVFEPFFVGSAPQGGTGLGLSISRALARAMGGDLQAVAASSGAVFRLSIALGPVDPVPSLEPGPAQPDVSACRVLVVDDIATNRLVAATLLRILGVQVTEAASGAEALDAIAADCPDMVLLDMNMPGLSGLQTVARLRDLPSVGARPQVLAMTADATAGHRAAYLAAGLDGYLAKPLTLDALRAALTNHFGPQRA